MPILYSAGRDGDDDGGVPIPDTADRWSRVPADGDMIFWPPVAPDFDDP